MSRRRSSNVSAEFNSKQSFLHHLQIKHKMIKGNEEGAEEEQADEKGKKRKELKIKL